MLYNITEPHTAILSGSGQKTICAHCGKMPTHEGFEDYDGCLGKLKGDIMNACCGHGEVGLAYIQYSDGSRIAGEEAIAEQERLKP